MWERKEAEVFLEKARGFGSVLGLANIRNLMRELKDVQEELAVIHLAGTNGKGSTGAMLERMFRMAGYRTGRYSSPAVFCEEEKYQVDGVPINKEEFNLLLEGIAAACGRMISQGLPHPTLFEIETAAAFLWFSQKQCKVVILETGLGGAMDATNVIKKPLCSVFTSISMDHMGFLGDTLTKIAEQKAGIIKEGCPVITARQQPEVFQVLERVSREKHADLVYAVSKEVNQGADPEAGGTAGDIQNLHYEDGYLTFDWEHWKDLQLSLLGAYQADNAVCAIRTVHKLMEKGFSIGDGIIRAALKDTRWPGRFEVISQSPLMILDGAHNQDAAKKLRETLEMGFTNRRIIYIIGVLADKEHEKMLSGLLPLAEKVYTVTPNNQRGLSGEELCREARKYHDRVEYAESLREALAGAMADARELQSAEYSGEGVSSGAPMILAFGSLSYLGELKRELKVWQAAQGNCM